MIDLSVLDKSWLIALLGIFTLITIVYRITLPLTSSDYIINVSLYILLGLTIAASTWKVLDKTNISGLNNLGFIGILVMGIVGIIAFVKMLNTEPESYKLTHLYWITGIICFSIMMYRSYRRSIDDNILKYVLAALSLFILGAMTIIHVVPNYDFMKWQPQLLQCLWIMIGVQLFDLIYLLFSGNTDGAIKRLKIYSIIDVVLFSGFMLVDFKQITSDSKFYEQLVGSTGLPQYQLINYPAKSTNMILDLANMFTSLVNLGRKN